MEDPWGSPWATNDTSTTLEPALPRSTLELPGRTLTRQRSFTTQSPWATDDDGFSEWGTSDSGLALPTPAATSGGSLWGGWGGENGPNSSQTQLTPRAREGSLGHGQHSPAWPAATSPSLAQGKTLSRRSSARSLFNQPSPDPWVAEAQNRLSLPPSALISAEQVAFSTLDRHEEEVEEEDEEDGKEEKDEEGGDLAKGTEDGQHPATGLEGETKTSDAAHVPDEDKGEEGKPGMQADEIANEKEATVQGQAKSPSHSHYSSCSGRSQHDGRPESPITSMDEDSKDLPQIQRRPSAQVKELVDTLSELVKKNDDALMVPNLARGRQRSTSRGAISIRSVRTDHGSDFGDFEDAQGFNSAPHSRRPSFSGSPRPPNSGPGRTRSLSRSSLRGASALKATGPPAIPKERGSRFQELANKFGAVKFAPDLESIDKLFDVAKLDAEQPSAKDYSLDHVDGIINDSFTSNSERKTWWRISRHGTMRKHDSGDDENYRRITWASSRMREETNEIVRRWMEHDSYSGGRPSFGDVASAKGGAFNWNSRAEPLSMDQVFGKRKSTQHLKSAPASAPRPLSLQPQPRPYSHSRNLSTGVKSLPPRSPAMNSLPPPSPLSIPAPPRSPAFGWSTATNGSASETPTSSRPPSRTARLSIEVPSVNLASSKSMAGSTAEPESRNSLQLAPPPVPPSVPPEKPNDPAPEIEDDDDDEWGEMVVSPPSTSRPVSGFFDVGMNGSPAGLSTDKRASPVPKTDTSFTLDVVSSKLQQGETAAKAEAAKAPPVAPAAHVWDFSAFDATPHAPATPTPPLAPAIPPTITSKPEFEFDTPLQSPALSGPSRHASPISAFQLPKPPTPTIPTVLSRTSSIASFQLPQPTTPTVPLQPQHASKTSISSTISSGPSRPSSPAALQMSKPPTSPVPLKPQHIQRSSLSITRPSPLQKVLTPEMSSSRPMSPAIPSPLKSVSFTQNDGDESLAVRQIIDGLPDLSYMLR